MSSTTTAASTPLVDFAIAYNWGWAFTGVLTFENAKPQPLNGWELEFISPFKIGLFWGAQVVSETAINTPAGPAYQYVIKDVWWTRTVPANGSRAINFNVYSPLQQGAEPYGYVLNGEPLGPLPTPDTTRPTASLAVAANLNGVPTSPYRFTVTYSDNDSLDVTTLGTGDVQVTGPNGFSQLAKFIGTDTAGNGSKRTATYELSSAPGGGWDSTDNGTYSIALLANQVKDVSGNAATAKTLGQFSVNLPALPPPDTTPPTATLGTVANLSAAGSQPYQFTVTYGDDQAIALTSLDNNDIRVTGPNGFSQLATFVSINSSSNGSPRTATYQFAAPGGNWEHGDNGTYNLALVSNQVKDESGNAAVGKVLGSFTVNIPVPPPVDTTPPSSTLTAANLTTTPTSPYQFTVTYSDSTGVDASSFGTGDVRVTGPNGFSQLAKFIGTNASGNGSPRTVTYELSSAPGGAWESSDNGTYTIGLLASQIKDINGNFAAAKTLGQFSVNLPAPKFNYGEALQKSFLFYEAQRSGDLPNTNRIDWRRDSALNDGRDVGRDLSGGYYDAGDLVKYAFPMASAMTLLSWGVAEYRDGYSRSGQLDEALDAIRWGTDWLLKAHVTDAQGTKEFWAQVGNGEIDHALWGPPETMTMARPSYKIDRQNPGSDMAAEAAAALASASIIFRPTDVAYADKLLTHAIQLYDFADTYRGKYSDAIADADLFYRSWNGYEDELTWGAVWLHEALEAKGIQETNYLAKAEASYTGVSAAWTQSWSDKNYGAAILLAQETNRDRYRTDVETWLNNWQPGGQIQRTAGGLAWLSEWGSLRYSANTAFLAGIYGDTVTDPQGRYTDFAEDQIDYILGDNPRNSSYMVGFGNNSPLQPHHRGASGLTSYNNYRNNQPNAHILYGALVGGPQAANDYAYEDLRSNYVTNEVSLDYNAAFTGSLARMYEQFGGNPLSDRQLDALVGVDLLGI